MRETGTYRVSGVVTVVVVVDVVLDDVELETVVVVVAPFVPTVVEGTGLDSNPCRLG